MAVRIKRATRTRQAHPLQVGKLITDMPPTQMERGQVIALFAFDVGYELDFQLLDKELFPLQSGYPRYSLREPPINRGHDVCATVFEKEGNNEGSISY